MCTYTRIREERKHMKTELKEYRNPNNPENVPNVERAFRMIALILTQRNDGVKVELKGIRKKEAEKAS